MAAIVMVMEKKALLQNCCACGLPVQINYSTLNSDCKQLKYGTQDKAGLKLQSILNLRETKWTQNGLTASSLQPCHVKQTAVRNL